MDYYELKRQKEEHKRQSDLRYKENSKKRLLTNLERKFRTTMIGSLDAFEKSFGELWGHGVPLEHLDSDQRQWRVIWQETRSRILDNGNSNLRAAQNEIAEYTLHWNRYVNQLTVKPV